MSFQPANLPFEIACGTQVVIRRIERVESQVDPPECGIRRPVVELGEIEILRVGIEAVHRREFGVPADTSAQSQGEIPAGDMESRQCDDDVGARIEIEFPLNRIAASQIEHRGGAHASRSLHAEVSESERRGVFQPAAVVLVHRPVGPDAQRVARTFGVGVEGRYGLGIAVERFAVDEQRGVVGGGDDDGVVLPRLGAPRLGEIGTGLHEPPTVDTVEFGAERCREV